MSSLPAVGGARPAGSASPVNVAQDQATRGRQHRGATSTPTPRGGRFGRSRSPLAGHRDYADTPTSSTGRSSIRDYAADATTSRNNPHERSHDVDGNSNAAQGADMEPLTRHTDDAQMMAAQLTQALLQLANNATTAQPAAAASPTKSFDTRLDEACSAHHWVSRALVELVARDELPASQLFVLSRRYQPGQPVTFRVVASSWLAFAGIRGFFVEPPQLTAYLDHLDHLLELTDDFADSAVIDYHVAVYAARLGNPRARWGSIDTHLCRRIILEAPAPPQAPAARRTRDRAICYRFNHFQCNGCRRLHVCEACGVKHPVTRCQVRAQT